MTTPYSQNNQMLELEAYHMEYNARRLRRNQLTCGDPIGELRARSNANVEAELIDEETLSFLTRTSITVHDLANVCTGILINFELAALGLSSQVASEKMFQEKLLSVCRMGGVLQSYIQDVTYLIEGFEFAKTDVGELRTRIQNFSTILLGTVSDLEGMSCFLDKIPEGAIKQGVQNGLNLLPQFRQLVEELVPELRESEFPKQSTEFSVETLVGETAQFFSYFCELRQVSLKCIFSQGEGVKTYGRREKLRRVLINMIMNSVQSMPKGGRLTVSVRMDEASMEAFSKPKKNASWVRIDITDTGTGIPQEHLGVIFEPGFLSNGSSGFGLASSRAIIKECGGFVRVESSMTKGTSFSIYLPARHGSQRPQK